MVTRMSSDELANILAALGWEWSASDEIPSPTDCFAEAGAVIEAMLAAHESRAARNALIEAANEWDRADPEHLAALRKLADEEYSPGGPSMPAIWLRRRAALDGGA